MSTDQPVRPGTVDTDNQGAMKILSEQTNSDFAGINSRTQITADSAAMAASSAIPDLHISGLDAAPNTGAAGPQRNPVEEIFHDLGTVASDLKDGMMNELT